MGFRTGDDYKRILNGGEQNAPVSGSSPNSQDLHGPWPQAFPDSVAANRASEGVRILRDLTQFDPQRNWVDVATVDAVNGVWAKFAFEGDVYFTGGVNALSGGRALYMREAGPGTPAVKSPVFRITEGRPYRFSITWKSAGTAAGTLKFTATTYKYDLSSLSVSTIGGLGGIAGSGGAWRTNTGVITPIAGHQWARFAITTANEDVYIDEIRIEEVPPSFRADTSNTAAWLNAWQTVTFESETFDYGANFDPATGTFTAPASGLYQLNGVATFASSAWTAGNRISSGFWVNGTFESRGSENWIEVSTTEIVGVQCSDLLPLGRGDTVVWRVFHSNAANRSLSTTAGDCIFSGFRAS